MAPLFLELAATACVLDAASLAVTPAATSSPAEAGKLAPADGELQTPTPAVLSFEDQRVIAVQYLGRLNDVLGDYRTSLDASGATTGLSRGSAVEVNAFVNNLPRLTQGFNARLDEFDAPVSIPDLVELDRMTRDMAVADLVWVSEYRDALFGGDAEEVAALDRQRVDVLTRQESGALDSLTRSVMATYNIPDDEVGLKVVLFDYGNEQQVVQAAMDLFMADTAATSVTANAVATSDFSAATPTLFPSYLRQNPSRCTYTWMTTGRVTRVACPDS